MSKKLKGNDYVFCSECGAEYNRFGGGTCWRCAEAQARGFDGKPFDSCALIASVARWDENYAVYVFPDGSTGRFTDIADGAQQRTAGGEPVVRFEYCGWLPV